MDRDCYVFGAFRLFLAEMRLERKDNREEIPLGRRSYDVLVMLVSEYPNYVSRAELLNAVWQEKGNVIVEEGNLSTQISNLRKALGDSLSDPVYIKTVRARGFRFVAPVERMAVSGSSIKKSAPVAVTNSKTGTSLEVESHVFVPIYVGAGSRGGSARSTRWGVYQELSFDVARLCIPEFGVGVWHIREVVQFSHLSALASWRRDLFQSIFRRGHGIVQHTETLLESAMIPSDDELGASAGEIVYALSVFVLKRHNFDAARLRPALKLIACPKVLLWRGGPTLDQSAISRHEQQFLETGFEHSDLREFGMHGFDLGFAGWSGVSYCQLGNQECDLGESIIEFEVGIQALWLFCHLIRREIERGDGKYTSFKRASSRIRRQLSLLRAIGPRDPTEERTMCEAIYLSSRVEDEARATLDLIERL